MAQMPRDNRRPARRRRAVYLPSIDALPKREMMAADVTAVLDGSLLRVNGTDAAETIWVQKTYGPGNVVGVAVESKGTTIQVPILADGGMQKVVAAGRVARIQVDARGGDDSVLLSSYGKSKYEVQYEVDLPSTLLGGAGNDLLVGGRGDDEIHGHDGDDILVGGRGHDWLQGWAGNNTLEGGTGNDTLLAGGNGSMVGGDGEDRLVFHPGTAASRIDGGTGSDTMDLSPREGRVFVSLAEGYGTMEATQRREFRGIVEVENVVGTAFDDQIVGNSSNNVIEGRAGNDTLYGGSGKDTLYGGSGNDTLDGGSDNDTLLGEEGQNKLDGGDGQDTLSGVAGFDFLVGGRDTDNIAVSFNLDNMKNLMMRSFVDVSQYANGRAGTDNFRVFVDLGGFGQTIVQPMIDRARTYTQKLQPLVDTLNRQVPGLNETIASLISKYGGGNLTGFVDTINTINTTDLRNLSGRLDLGTFQVSKPDLSGIRNSVVGNPLSSLALGDRLQGLKARGLDIPVFTDPRSMIQVLLGQDIDLVSLDLGLSFGSGNLQKSFTIAGIPYIGELQATLGGSLDAKVSAHIGYDTNGLRNGSLRDGFYIRADASASFEANASASFGVSANIILARGSASLGGAVSGALKTKLSDPNRDGKVRLGELNASSFQLAGSINTTIYVDWQYRVFNPVPFWPGWWITKSGRHTLK